MYTYESRDFDDLAEQLRRGPRRLRLRQLAAIDFLLSVAESDKSYPFDFVRHALTGYRRPAIEKSDEDLISSDGAALRRDLVTLAEDLSENAAVPLATWPDRLYSVAQLAERFGVSTKTIFRWRRRGLVGWKFRCEDRRIRLAFPEHCIRRFVAENVDLVNRGSSFSQLTKTERAEIVNRAQALVEDDERTINAVSKVLAAETGRAVETIRLILKHFDESHPKEGLFNRSALALAVDDHRLALWEAYVDGASVETLAKRFDKPVRSVYEVITEMRARDLKTHKIEFVPSEEFELEGIEDEINEDAAVVAPYDESSRTSRRIPANLPPYLQHLFRLPLLNKAGEQALFRKMNFLKFKADKLRHELEPETCTAAELDATEALLEQANRIKNQIVRANLRLVVSIAKRHASPQLEFFEIVSDGNISLMRAVEKFDYSRGFKFSTYASWAIMKNYARTMPNHRKHSDRYQTGREELLEIVASPDLDDVEDDRIPALRATVEDMLSTLDERERKILRQRFGLDGDEGPQTLEQIGKRFGVSKERIRQLEARAMSKLRGDFQQAISKLLAG